MGDTKTMVFSFLISILIMVGVGATFISMATDPDTGYNVEVSDAFNENSVYFNITEAQDLVGNITDIGHNMSDSVREAEARPFEDFYDVIQQVANLVVFPFKLFDFAKNFMVAFAEYIGIPPIALAVATGILVFLIVFAVVKFLTGRDP